MAAHKLAIVLGSSASALEEFDGAQRYLSANGFEPRVVCVNGAVRISPVKPYAFCTVFTPAESAKRFLEGVDLEGVRMFSRRAERGAFNAVRSKWRGDSGLYAVQIALQELGFAGVILAGCPIDASGGTLCPHSEMAEPTKADRFKPAWVKALPEIRERTRSMSGWTRDLLGAPCQHWIAQIAAQTPPRHRSRS